ncbi:hypothetical protein AGLY_014642 [Aphis glycines]|uniref:MULE transposase domain-containing protein n=1 Tax=Aphis glycines TaxID=307491 RepID=A0A6G0T264_APHGL|nr:hypothetical protein AGLY_014642 [Aphis glycines]
MPKNPNSKLSDKGNHSEYSENEIEKEMIRSVVKRKAETELYIQPSKTIRQALHLNQGNNLKHSDIHLLRNSMYAARKKQFPTLPKNINEAINQIREMQENLLFKGEQFIYLSKDENVVILTYPKNLSVLCNPQHVFGDGTFDYCLKLFNQLYTIHIYQNHFYVPDLCVHTLNQELNIKEFHVDFEISAHNALLNLYPDCKIVACTFHLAQS